MGRNVAGGGGFDRNAPGGLDVMFAVKVRLTPTQVKGLFGAPVLLVGAPGAGRALQIFGAIAQVSGGTTNYASGADLILGLGVTLAQLSNVVIPHTSIAGTADQYVAAQTGLWNPNTGAKAQFENLAIYLATAGPNFTTGDRDVDITVFYAIVGVS